MLVIAKDQKIIETFVKIIITLRVVGCFIHKTDKWKEWNI